jgi:hypothetical protein
MGSIATPIAVVALAAGPVGAATVGDGANWDGTAGSTIQFVLNPLSANPGDSVAVDFSSADPQAQIAFFTTVGCSGSVVGTAVAGGTATWTPSSSATYYAFALDSSAASACTSFTVDVGGTPPPDVPEAPLAAGLVGMAAVLFGFGFLTMRRRRNRVTTTKGEAS